MRWLLAFYLLGIAVILGFWGTVIYVLWHFISKFW